MERMRYARDKVCELENGVECIERVRNEIRGV